MISSFKRIVHHPEFAPLILTILAVVGSLTLGFEMLIPFWISLIIAFLQQYQIDSLSKYVPYKTASIIVCFVNLLIVGGIVFDALPFIYGQSLGLIQDFPEMMEKLATALKSNTGGSISLGDQLHLAITEQGSDIMGLALQSCLDYVPSAVHFIIYCVTMPVIIFFFNYDKDFFIKGYCNLYPTERPTLNLIASEILEQIDYYIRGKLVQIVVIGSATFLLCWYCELNYALFISIPLGISTLIPFVGAALGMIPLFALAYAQFGLAWNFMYIVVGYFAIHLWNENILIPMIFSQSNDMHPVVILGSILIFGHLGGLLGVFLAIPVAAIMKVLIKRWPILEEA